MTCARQSPVRAAVPRGMTAAPAPAPAPLTPDQRAELEHLERCPGLWLERPPSRALEQLLAAEFVERVAAPVRRHGPAWVAARREPDDRYRATERGRAALERAQSLDATYAWLGGVESW